MFTPDSIVGEFAHPSNGLYVINADVVRDGKGSASTSGENAARRYSAAARAVSGGA